MLCDLFRTPKSIAMCLGAGVITPLAQMVGTLAHMVIDSCVTVSASVFLPQVLDVDDTTRIRASKAMNILAEDANGRSEMLRTGAQDIMFPALNDSLVDVRINVMTSLIKLAATLDGVQCVCRAGYVELLVRKAKEEVRGCSEMHWAALLIDLADDLPGDRSQAAHIAAVVRLPQTNPTQG